MELLLLEVTNPQCGYLKKFEYVVDIHSNGVPSTHIEWCNTNCKHRWGWHFWQSEKAKELSKYSWHDDWLPPKEVVEGTKAYVSFENYDEMILFKIINLSG